MLLRILKHGDLLGSPDCKERLLRAGPGTDAAHALWEEIYAIKIGLGLGGRATSALLIEPECPEHFPAVVDLSCIYPGSSPDDERSVEEALELLRKVGLPPEEVRTILVTHQHPDHFDPRLLDRLRKAKLVAPNSYDDDIPVASLEPWIQVVDTPGHGGPHQSYVVDFPAIDLTACFAGDLVMSQSHFMSRDHPLSYEDHEAAEASLDRVAAAFERHDRKHQLILPGHDVPFFWVRS